MRIERNFRQTTKAAFAFAFTTATYLLARTTGFLPSWFSEETPAEKGVLGVTVIPRDDGFEIAGQRRLLQTGSGVTVANPIPDQVIQVDQQYTYSLNNVFSGNYSLLGAVETGKSSLPSWLSLQPKLLSIYPAGLGQAYGVAINGSTAFVADHSAGLQILDVSNTNNPQLLSITAGLGQVRGVALSGSAAFVTDYQVGRLQILDVSNTSNPRLLSNFSGVGTASGIVISGSTAFVAGGGAGLKIIDVSNTSNPRLLSTFPAGSLGSVYGVAISGVTAFVADGTLGLKIVDVSNTSNPRLLSTYPTGIGQDCGVAISGNTAFVAGGSVGLRIIDVSNTSNPRLLSIYPAGSFAEGVTLSGRTVFVADNNAGLQVIDVSNLSNPRLLSTYPTGSSGVAHGIAMSGNTAFVADGSVGLQLIDVGQAGLIGIPPNSLVGQQYSITVSTRNMSQELASDSFGLILDQLPRVVQSSVTDQSIYPGNSLMLLLNSELLFVNPSHSFLQLSLVLSNKLTIPQWLSLNLLPLQRSAYPLTGQGNGVAISGNTAFVASGFVGLQILDVSDLSNPRSLLTYATANALGIALSGSTAFVADYSGGLRILDVSNSSNPRLLSTYSILNALGVAISGNTAFVAAGTAGFKILDVSNTSNPRLLSTFPVGPGGSARGVAISSSTAFVAGDISGLQVIDVSNLSNPRLLATVSAGGVGGSAYAVVISENTVFVADRDLGLQVIDVSNTSNPHLLSTLSAGSGGSAYAVAISGSMVFVADGTLGLQIIDVSNTSNPRLLSTVPAASGNTLGVAISGNAAFMAQATGGFQIVDLSQWQLTTTPGSSDVGNYRLQITATDELGGTASTQPFTIRVEGPPQITGVIPAQSARVGQFFNYFMPQGLFVDPNFDPISFIASLVDGTALPSWLAFNGISAAFAGTPSSAGNITILLRATDNIAGSVNTTFNIITSYLPVTDLPIAEQIGRIGAPYYFRMPSTAFFDQDGDIVNYTSLRANGQPLPIWLRFNATVATFSGYPNQTEAGQYDLQILAMDRYSGQASTVFRLWVEYFPVVNQTLIDQIIGVGDLFSFALPPLAFTDADSSQLSYRARRPDGSLLPNWLAFNPQTLIFNGQPLSSDRGVLTVQVVAIDPLGASATQNFNLTVVDVPTLGVRIPQQLLNVGVFNQFQISSSAFNYAGSDALRYSAYQQVNQSLPVWLQFNNASLTFSGTPLSNQSGDYSLSVVARDNYAHAVSNAFDLVVERFPVVNQSIAAASGSVGNPMTFTISGAAFADPDGDPLTYSARRADGSGLPNWLTFDGSSRVFSGIPVVTDIGAMALQVIATDPLGGSAQQNMTLNILYAPVINTPPPALKPLREQRVFNLTLSPQTFSDPGGAPLNYSASQVDGSPLPSWLTFFPLNLSLSGTPAISDVGTFSMQITATNPQGAYVNLPLSLVIWANYPPQVMQTLSNQLATVLNAFQFFAPPDTFSDVNEDVLHYTATQVNGQPLPGWLRFDAKKLGFFGTPSRRDTGNFAARVIPVALTAHDDKSSTSTQFNISVQGTSSLALFLQVIIPLLSGLAGGYGIYKKRAFLLNRYKPQRYQQLAEEKMTVGDTYERQLATPADQVKKVQVVTPHPRKDCLRLFMLPYRPLPGGLNLPTWLSYDTNANILHSKGPIPARALPHLIVQVRGKDDVILEQFPLHIARDPGDAKELGEAQTEAQTMAPSLPTIDDEDAIEMQPVSSNTEMSM